MAAINMTALQLKLLSTYEGCSDKKQPANPFHPGETLLEESLQPAGMTQTAFAERLGWTRARLNELIRGKRGITAESELDLAEALGTSARLWMNLQATFDLDQAMKHRSVA
jgi:addiction module HigA family antidote